MKTKQEDFIGVWKSESGQSILYLNEDGSCSGELDSFFFRACHDADFYLNSIGIDRGDLSKYNETKQFNGNWYFNLKDFYHNQSYISILDETQNINFALDIRGSNGILENKPPWYLFFYIGDPDDMEKYKFFKQENGR
jgi:hypothetical protein